MKAGDILFQIDPAPYRIALERADAQMNAAALALASLKQQYAQTLADAQAARADAALAAKQLDRVSALADRQFASRADFDKAQSALTAAQAKVASLDQAAQAKLAELAGDPDLPLERFPQYLEAKAARDDAQRNLDQSTVRATIDGVVSQTDQLVPGYYVNVGTMAAVVVSATNIWLDANLVETDLTHVAPGDAATVKVDTYPDTEFRGRVLAVAPATGAEFSVIPAQNASGNWVKVVQRVTVRVAIERRPGDPALRAGLSAYVAIDTGHSRSLADLF